MNPLNYSLCRQTVTVYRNEKGQLQRQVIPGCSYHWQDRKVADVRGWHLERGVLLIVPGDKGDLRPGDRIFEGVGPVDVDWDRWIPRLVPGLSEVAYVQPQYWRDRVCHTEAGRK